MKKFYITHNPDNDNKFVKALLQEGFVEVRDMAEAEFIIHDGVRREVVRAIGNRPAFIIPHTPQSWFLWDGLCAVTQVQCNFVAGQAAVDGMKAYGYPHRVEAIGFSRCDVREFRPSKGNDLLFVPAHALPDGSYAEENYVAKVMKVFDFIISHRRVFGKITVCWDAKAEYKIANEIRRYGINYVSTNPYQDRTPLTRMMERIESADLIMSCGTVGCVSVAMGKPTVFFSEIGIPHTPPGRATKHSELYLHRLRHPNMAEKMKIEEIVSVLETESEEARRWRIDNIGGQFNPEKFITVIEEGLQRYQPRPATKGGEGFQCPHCPSRHARLIRRNGKITLFQCVKCKRRFTITT